VVLLLLVAHAVAVVLPDTLRRTRGRNLGIHA